MDLNKNVVYMWIVTLSTTSYALRSSYKTIIYLLLFLQERLLTLKKQAAQITQQAQREKESFLKERSNLEAMLRGVQWHSYFWSQALVCIRMVCTSIWEIYFSDVCNVKHCGERMASWNRIPTQDWILVLAWWPYFIDMTYKYSIWHTH